jgi:hypothetical protein
LESCSFSTYNYTLWVMTWSILYIDPIDFLPTFNRISELAFLQLQHSHYNFLFMPILTYTPEPYVSISFLYRYFVDIIFSNAFFPNLCVLNIYIWNITYRHQEHFIRVINKIPIVYCIVYLFSVRFVCSIQLI